MARFFKEWWNDLEAMNFLVLVLMLFLIMAFNPFLGWIAPVLILILYFLAGFPFWISAALPYLLILGFCIYAALWVRSKEEGYFIVYS